jgi:hypothetical protein
MFLSSVMILAMAMAAPKADPVDKARIAYNNCLVELHNKNVEAQATTEKFNEAVAASCETEKTAYRDTILKAERGYGSKQSEAEKYADEEVKNVVDYFLSAFAENVGQKAVLQAQK